jgi:lipopolysaccharide/colanic/teichoic acid biosynthesis glycosyltransferase
MIAAVGRSGSVKVQYLSADLGFEPHQSFHAAEDVSSSCPARFEIREDELERMRSRRYWQLKRTVDVVGSVLLLTALAAVLLLIALSVTIVMGWPPVFWQQRPGLGGRPFRLYKFRTMGSPFAPDGRRIPDAERVSRLGIFLRRTHLDELPQLFNILRGDMSFIGPRPLLPCDQDKAYRARLLIRPGLTGWAQVVGGRSIPAEDKAALDIWYFKNASISLDVAVMWRTIGTLFMGERVSPPLIERAWRDLRQADVLTRGFAGVPASRAPIHSA